MRERTYAVLAGGGTVGHVAPALSVAAALVERGHDRETIHFVGSRRGMESELVPAAGFPLTVLAGRGLRRKLAPSDIAANVKAIAGLTAATARALRLMRKERPSVVVNLGGYASVPCTLAAVALRVPIVVVSYDAVPGRASRLAARFAKVNAVALPSSTLRNAVVTGAPVRPEVLALDREPETRAEARRQLGLPADAQVVAVTSGSLGALRVNEATLGLARLWADRPNTVIYHAIGRRDFAAISSGAKGLSGTTYRPVEFEQRLPLLLSACDVAIGRAGASTIAELTVIGVPSVLVPLPNAPADHQTQNARRLEHAGAAVLLPDAECTPERLAAVVGEMLADPGQLEMMGKAASTLGRRDAAERIAELVEAHGKQRKERT
jgi:UDP-N-acetylglucosamine--N-acetylmuramyl-(pentapeptide) pyrophosphoryl-undecaprenol N-acetylglucosamine transferase